MQLNNGQIVLDSEDELVDEVLDGEVVVDYMPAEFTYVTFGAGVVYFYSSHRRIATVRTKTHYAELEAEFLRQNWYGRSENHCDVIYSFQPMFWKHYGELFINVPVLMREPDADVPALYIQERPM